MSHIGKCCAVSSFAFWNGYLPRNFCNWRKVFKQLIILRINSTKRYCRKAQYSSYRSDIFWGSMCQPWVWHGIILLFVLEEKFAQAVCFLLVDLYLLTFQPEKALHLLTVLDKLSVQGSNKNGKGEVCPHTTLWLKDDMSFNAFHHSF